LEFLINLKPKESGLRYKSVTSFEEKILETLSVKTNKTLGLV
jgi:hypothetical protein